MNFKVPFEKEDVHYDSVKGEVSLKRQKFDDLIHFVRQLIELAQELENERDTARSRQRRAATAADQYAELLEEANQSVRRWLQTNSIQQLSRLTGVPYATCHRIVNDRLRSAEVTVGTLGKILRAIGPAHARRKPAVSLFVGKPAAAASWKHTLERMKSTGVQIVTAHSGLDAAAKAQEHSSMQVILDVSAPELNEKVLSQIAGHSRVMVVTGGDQEKARKLVELTADI